MKSFALAFLAPTLFIVGCPVDDGAHDHPADIEPICTEPVADVLCRDQSLVALNMDAENVTDGDIENEALDGFTHSTVDADVGGLSNPGYVYAKFTEDGLERVEVTDDESFESMDWDIAFHRFVIRLNSGVGGPSCVTAARTGTGTDFALFTRETLDSVSEELDFNAEQYMTEDSCDMIPDGSGLPNSPGVVLQNYWTYVNCVQMTGNVYVVELADGHHVKLLVTHFYDDAAQTECNDTGSNTPSGSGHIQLHWAFLD